MLSRATVRGIAILYAIIFLAITARGAGAAVGCQFGDAPGPPSCDGVCDFIDEADSPDCTGSCDVASAGRACQTVSVPATGDEALSRTVSVPATWATRRVAGLSRSLQPG